MRSAEEGIAALPRAEAGLFLAIRLGFRRSCLAPLLPNRAPQRAETVGALVGDHPAGVFGRQRADFIESFDLVVRELEVDGGEIVLKLADSPRADNHRSGTG